MIPKGKPLPNEEEFNIKVPWGTISGLTWGDSSLPPVLLVHGKMHACTGFRPLVSLLPPAYYIAFDLPGNGRSSHFPKGLKLTVTDFIPAVYFVVEHFGLKKFAYVGHSLGVVIGKYFNIVYPGHIARFVELDPIPAHHSWETDEIRNWYRRYYHMHYVKKIAVFISGPETAPSYEYDQALQQFADMGLSKSAGVHLMERILEPAGNGLYRYSYDQRMKDVAVPPFSGDYLQQVYTQVSTPTLCILALDSVTFGFYEKVPFVMDESAWKNKNYKYKVVEGTHDVHINNPERLADFVKEFLFEGLKAKL